MDKIQFTFPCLIVLLGLVLTSTTTAQTQPVNLTVTQPTSASNPANDTATPGHTTTVDNYDLTFSAITPSLPDQIFDNISITNSTGRPNHTVTTVTTTLKTSSDASPGPTSWPSPPKVPTPKPPAEASSTTASTSATSTTKDTGFAGTAQPKPPAGKLSHVIGLIILIVIILTTCVIGAACFFTKKMSRRYSVDLQDRREDLPLSTVDSDAVFDNFSTQKGMDTFAAVDLNTTEVLLVKGSEGEREDEKISDYPPPASPVDKPDDGVPVGETDDENTVSNKTSVEANENNNNTTVTTTRIASTTPRGRAMTSSFSEVPLDNPA